MKLLQTFLPLKVPVAFYQSPPKPIAASCEPAVWQGSPHTSALSASDQCLLTSPGIWDCSWASLPQTGEAA